MVTSTNRQTSTNDGSTNHGATHRKPTTKSSARGTSSRRKSVNSGGRLSEIPNWATTVASVVGVSVAVGVGLFATRNQWLPKAEQWGDQLAARFRAHEDDEFYGDSLADDDDDLDDKLSQAVHSHAPTDRDLYPAAQSVS